MPEYVLHSFAQSGNAYKAALMLQLSQADWTPRFVDFFNGETRRPEWRASVNVMGEVPVLEHGDAKLTQSGVILDYLVERLGTFGWRDGDERREILRWMLWDNHKLTSYTATYRFFKMFAQQLAKPDVQTFMQARMLAAFGVLDGHLRDRSFVATDQPTIADLSLCGYLFFDDEIGVDWGKDFPAIGAWLGRIKALPDWRHPYDLLPGHPLPAQP